MSVADFSRFRVALAHLVQPGPPAQFSISKSDPEPKSETRRSYAGQRARAFWGAPGTERGCRCVGGYGLVDRA